MTALSTRDALVTWFMHNVVKGDERPRDPELIAFCERSADALLASGVVIDAATLADDEALVEQVFNESLFPKNQATVRSVLRALAAALTEWEPS